MATDDDVTIWESGPRLRVVSALRGGPADEFLDDLPEKERDVLRARFFHLANSGPILNTEHFRHLGEQIYEHKYRLIRVLGFFHKGRFVLTHGFQGEKRGRGKTPTSHIERAKRIRDEYVRKRGTA